MINLWNILINLYYNETRQNEQNQKERYWSTRHQKNWWRIQDLHQFRLQKVMLKQNNLKPWHIWKKNFPYFKIVWQSCSCKWSTALRFLWKVIAGMTWHTQAVVGSLIKKFAPRIHHTCLKWHHHHAFINYDWWRFTKRFLGGDFCSPGWLIESDEEVTWILGNNIDYTASRKLVI